jgi:carbamoyltransferase
VPTRILGVSGLYHDAAAVLLEDGRIVAAVQEERFSRLKHDPALPVRAARHCLDVAGITPRDVDWLVFYEKPLRKFERILATSVATFPRGWRGFPRQMHAWLGDRLWLRAQLTTAFGVPADRLLFCEHHLSHAASAFFCSPHDEAAVLCVDGVGEWATTSLWRGQGSTLTPVSEVRWPHSIGLFYSAITAHLGFAVNEGEYKVMGMAAYGEPRFRARMDELLRLDDRGAFSVDLDTFCWHWHPTRASTDRLARMLGPARFPGTPFTPRVAPGNAGEDEIAASQLHADVAASAQAAVEDALLHLVRHAHTAIPTDALCLAGGVALNAVANGRIAAAGPHAHLWVQPAAGDAGGALGAALWAWHAVLGNPRGAPLCSAALGRETSAARTAELLVDLGARYDDLGDTAPERAAEDLAAGKVIGWVEGREEWGPRALGQRSILADPGPPDVRERVNQSVKFREPFRPFAPSVLAAEAARCFDIPAAAAEPARFMLSTHPVRAEARETLAAVTHVDGTARVQVVDAEAAPTFHRLLRGFAERTGVPALLNTSFNLKGEPLVSTPVDALAAFARSDLDTLYVNGFRVERMR